MAEVTRPDYTYQWSSGGANVAPSNTKIQTGWTAEVPPFQWENWSQNRQDNAIVHLFQKGISLWSATQDYYYVNLGARSYVQGSDGFIYVALQNSIGQNPVTASAYWKLAFPVAGRLLRTSVYRSVAGTLQISVDGGAFTNAGSSTFVAVNNAGMWDVEVQGSGGAGGGASPTTAGQVSAGSGGGAGGYARGIFTTGVNGGLIVVGAPRIGVVGAGPNGQPSSVGSVIAASGGIGGTFGAAIASNNQFAGQSAGGSGTSGYLQVAGGAGEPGFYGTNPTSGCGGASFFGSGGTVSSGTSSGTPGANYGSGGGGGVAATSVPTGASGGNSASGLVIIREYSV